MGVVVAFVYAAWILRYPQFTSPNGAQPVSSDLATLYFNEATVYHANNGGGLPVRGVATQSILLNQLTAHIATMNALMLNGEPPSPIIGRINNASEGSVSVQTEYNTNMSDAQAWLCQTPPGAAYWAATKQYRSFRYFPGRRRVFDPFAVIPRLRRV